MGRLERTLYELNRMEQSTGHTGWLYRLDARVKLVGCLLYLIGILTIPATDLMWLILAFACPIVLCAVAGVAYGGLLRRSLVVLPFVLCIALFNPLLDRRPLFRVGDVMVTEGWVTACALLLRALLTTQMLLLLVRTTGFHRLCRALERLGVPSLLATQLLFVYRYLFVLLQEALAMQRARVARGYGRKGYPLKMWGTFIGRLLLRTVERAERIHRAMVARGYAHT